MSKEHAVMRYLMLLVLVVGCSTKPNPKSCLDNHCSDPDLPFCDVDGAIGGEPNTCIAVDCTPNQFEECRGNEALTCNAAGDNYVLAECEFGCGADGCKPCDRPECEKHIAPKFVPTACNELSVGSLDVTSNMTLDTSNPVNCTSVVVQPTGPEICVLKYKEITIASNQTLTITGTRAVAFVADRALTLNGILDVSAAGSTNGPGGGTQKSGSNSTAAAAGGGAGYRTVGGAGGTNDLNGGAGNGGQAAMNPTLIAELFGGRQPSASTRLPGGAGGAVTLVSCRANVSITGVIDAGGGGGEGDALVTSGGVPVYRFAAGGGSGGTIVLQGLTVSVTGEIYANGGGGGAGANVGAGARGADGQRSTMMAAGGAGNGGGSGGAGGTDLAPQGGFASSAPGAGGGSAGFIIIYTPEMVFPTVTPVGVSPSIEPKQTVATN